MDRPHRLLLAARNSLPYFAPELRDQVASLLTLENFAFLAAFIAADIFFAGTGIGVAVNVIAGGLAIAFIGTQAFSGVRSLYRFYRLASKAETSDQFQEAGKEFAGAVTHLGVATLAFWLSKRTATRSKGKAKAWAPNAEASWRGLADSIEFNIPRDSGVIFAGIPESEALQAIANSRNIQGEVINKTASQYGWTQENMIADFGKNSATTYRLWEYLSLKYQQALKGRVTAYIDSTQLRPDQGMLTNARGAGPEVEMSDGSITPSVIRTELEELMTSNKAVTSIVLKDVRTGKTWVYLSHSKSTSTH